MTDAAVEADPLDVRRARSASGLLRAFNEAGVLAAADVHVASRLGQLAGKTSESVLLAAALAVRGPRLGHVCVDLTTIRESATVDAEEAIDVSALPWPAVESWRTELAASALVSVGEESGADDRPLRLVGTNLYLDRYWREERQLASDLLAFAAADPSLVDESVLTGGLARLFPRETGSRQSLAAASAVLRRFAVVAGGPGTGKTTTVARIMALLCEQTAAAGAPAPLIALAAPTGKAAARLEEAVREQAGKLDVSDEVRDQMSASGAMTLHRLLGRRPGSYSRFRHDRANKLPHDVVIVDESSMVSLSLMTRLVEAIRPTARLVLVGDPGQLTSIEAGAVLADVVGPAIRGPRFTAAARETLERVTVAPVKGGRGGGADAAPLADSIVVLDRVHRYGTGIAAVADAIRDGDGDATIAALTSGGADVTWIDVDAGEPEGVAALDVVRAEAIATGRAVFGAARDGHAREALAALTTFRILCAHRRGAHGVATWMSRVESWLTQEVEGFAADTAWYPGRPLLVTANDYVLRLYNGDTGVVVTAEDGHPTAAFDRGDEITTFRPGRLSGVDTVHAMTIHKSQGSQFRTIAVVLPAPTSQILTRELLYTAVTRAAERLVLVGTKETVRAAVARPVARASGLEARLWERLLRDKPA